MGTGNKLHPGMFKIEPTPMVYPTRRKAINDIASWIELIYNQARLHSALGYRTQGEAEHDLASNNKTT